MLESFLLYLLIGIPAAVVVGFFATGSSMVILPTLSFIFPEFLHHHNLAIHMAVGTCMTSIFLSAAIVVVSHHKQGTIDWPLVFKLLPAFIIAPLLGSFVSHLLPAHILRIYVGAFVLFAGVQMCYRSFYMQKRYLRDLPKYPWLLLATFIIGFFSSIAGVALGLLNVPYLCHIGLDVKRAISTSIAGALFYTFFGALGYIFLPKSHLIAYTTGYVYWPAVIAIALPVMFIAPLFVRLATKLNNTKLKRLFSLFLVIAGINLIVITFV